MEERKEPRPELPKEPVISWAERNLKDFSTLPDPEAAIFVTDLALLAPSEGKDGVYFAPDAEVQPDELQYTGIEYPFFTKHKCYNRHNQIS